MKTETVIILENDDERNMLHSMLGDHAESMEIYGIAWEVEWNEFWKKNDGSIKTSLYY